LSAGLPGQAHLNAAACGGLAGSPAATRPNPDLDLGAYVEVECVRRHGDADGR
jgi:hypothetical protein